MSPNVKVSTISKLTDIRMHDPLPQVDLMFVVKFSETRVPTKGKHRKLKTASSTAVTVMGFNKWCAPWQLKF